MRPVSWLVLLLALCSPPVLGQQGEGGDQAPPDPVKLPDPRQLATDWWRYIAEAGEDLQPRLEYLVTQVERTVAELSEERRAQALAIVATLRTGSESYRSLRETPTPASGTVHQANDRYSFAALLGLHQRLHALRAEIDFDQQEIGRTEKAMKHGKRELDTARAAYVQRPVADPGRLMAGLQIIVDRLNLELAREDLRLEEAQLRLRREELASLEPIVEAAGDRLVIDARELARLAEQERAAVEEAERFRSELARLQLSQAYGVADTAEVRLRNRQREISVAIASARLAAAELARDVYATGVILGESAAGTSLLSEAVRVQLADAGARSDASREAREEWLQIVRRGQAGMEEQLENPAAMRTWFALQGQLQEALARVDVRLRDAQLTQDLLVDRLATEGGWLSSAYRAAGEVAGGALAWVGGFMSMSLFEVSQTPVTPLGLVRVVVILGIAWFVSRVVRRGLDRVRSNRDAVSQAALYTVGRVLHYLLLLVGMLIALSSIGIDFTKFALFASALGVGIGFGLQNLISNFVAGLILLFERSLKVGDFVELESGVTGEVREISIRSTLITTNDNVDIVVPNAEFVSTRVTNWTMHQAYRRARIPFGVAYGTDKELVRRAALEAANEVPHTLMQEGREPRVWLVRFGESSLDFELVVWLKPDAVKRPGTITADYNWAIESALGRYGIEIPFPQRDLHLHSFYGLTGEEARSNLFSSGLPRAVAAGR